MIEDWGLRKCWGWGLRTGLRSRTFVEIFLVENHALLRTFQNPQNARVRTFWGFFQLWGHRWCKARMGRTGRTGKSVSWLYGPKSGWQDEHNDLMSHDVYHRLVRTQCVLLNLTWPMTTQPHMTMCDTFSVNAFQLQMYVCILYILIAAHHWPGGKSLIGKLQAW